MEPKKGILIAFGELFLKSERVKKIFKRKLIKNLTFFLRKENLAFNLFPFRERIFIEAKKIKKALALIKNLSGISWVAAALFFPKASFNIISDFVSRNYQNWIKKGETFAIRLKKDSQIKVSSKKIIETLAGFIQRKVDLEKPKKEIFVEARNYGYFLYFKKLKGLGGLPLSAGGKVLTLISGGIDSPVASFLMAKRGVEQIWLHFHSFPLLSKRSIEKVRKLAKIFLKFQPKLKIYFLPFSDFQEKVKISILPKYRILIYRRVMLRAAERIAKKEKAKAIVTGESLGQVSSQTLENLNIIQEKIKIPVFRPLIGFNKEEIISLAKKIKTYEISILPQEDCCTLFTPLRASAFGNLEKIKKEEKKINLEKEIREILKKAQIEVF